MAELTVEVRTAKVELRTVELTAAILKQMPAVVYDDFRKVPKDKVLGWVSGVVLGPTRTDFPEQWVIVELGEGRYARFSAMAATVKHIPQLYVV